MEEFRDPWAKNRPVPRAARPKVLRIDAEPADEFDDVSQLLQSPPVAVNVRRTTDIPEACALADTDRWFPDLIVVEQSWPDQYAAADVHRLLTMFPLARLICCYGAWCDSDGRNRSIWPTGSRIIAENAPTRIRRELELLTGPADIVVADAASVGSDAGSIRHGESFAAPVLSLLPLTASRTEVFAHDYSAPVPGSSSPQSVAVISPDRAWREMLERALSAAGCRVTTTQADARIDRLHWDADPWDDERQNEIRSIRQNHPQGRITAWTGFARSDLLRVLQQNGATDTACKLGPLTQLVVSTT